MGVEAWRSSTIATDSMGAHSLTQHSKYEIVRSTHTCIYTIWSRSTQHTAHVHVYIIIQHVPCMAEFFSGQKYIYCVYTTFTTCTVHG